MTDRLIQKIIEGQEIVTSTADTTVGNAAKLMREKHIGAVLVVENGKLAGIFTERDALFRVVAEGRDLKATRLSDVMTPDPDHLPPEKPFAHALILMHEHGYRHVPVVDHGRPVGVVSMRDALPPELDDLEHDLADREHIAEILG